MQQISPRKSPNFSRWRARNSTMWPTLCQPFLALSQHGLSVLAYVTLFLAPECVQNVLPFLTQGQRLEIPPSSCPQTHIAPMLHDPLKSHPSSKRSTVTPSPPPPLHNPKATPSFLELGTPLLSPSLTWPWVTCYAIFLCLGRWER